MSRTDADGRSTEKLQLSLVERLREYPTFYLNGAAWVMSSEKSKLAAEAADRIEQLERELSAERRQYAQCSEALNRALSAIPRSEEAHVLDAMCIASGYKRWWINSGKLFFERDGEPGYIQVLLVEKAEQAALASSSEKKGEG